MNKLIVMKKRGMGWMGLQRRQSKRFNSSNRNSTQLYDILSRVVHLSVEEVGSGLEGIKRVISLYKGVSGVYIFVNIRKKRVYVGSSLNISERMKFYKNMGKVNINLLREVKKNGWSGFKVIVIKVGGGMTTIRKWEYKIMNLIKDSGIMKLYNRFTSEKERVWYHNLIKKGVRGADKWVNRYIIIKGKMSRIARERGYGERQRGYWFKKGVEHPRAGKDKIRVIDIETGTSQVLILLEVLL